jgi:hypothetical protein
MRTGRFLTGWMIQTWWVFLCIAGCGDGGTPEGCPRDQVECHGTCTDTAVDPNHCGGCDRACSVDHGSPECVSGTCGISSCEGPWDDCDGQYDTGCETNTVEDLEHCGSCDLACTVLHGTPNCTSGVCGIAACDGAWDDCDDLYDTGCEVDTTNDDDNCGECDDPCAGGWSCVAGDCVDEGLVSLPDERMSEPVVLTGDKIAHLAGTVTDELFVFRYDDTNGWVQIPHQVDERVLAPLWEGAACPDECELRYLFDGEDPEGNGLDDDDEVVFLAVDVGEEAPGTRPAGVEDSGLEIRVVLPSEGVVGYAYLFPSSTLRPDFGGPLVSYTRSEVDAATEDTEVLTDAYRVHFLRNWVQDDIAVLANGGGDGVDLLDRWKGRAYERSLSGETEDVIGMCGGWSNPNPDWGIHLYLGHIDGPVRAIRLVQGACSWPNLTRLDVFYPGRADMILNVRGHPFGEGDGGIWGYWDWAEGAVPMTYYNPLVPDGTSIDGLEDPAYPNGDNGPEITEGWDQVDSAHGGLVFAFKETIDVPGPFKAFLYDDVSYDDGTGEDPQGDPGIIGGTGFHLLHVGNTDPALGGTPGQVVFRYWPMPANAGNQGAIYAAIAFDPLQTTTLVY